MNQYLFTTHEGYTISPNETVEVENCQLLARIDAPDISRARKLLVKENPWIKESGFNPELCTIDQIATSSQLDDIRAVVGHLWKDAKESYEEDNYPQNHIFLALRRLRDMVSEAR